MIEFHLSKTWWFDPTRRLGDRGGFGEVFEGLDDKGTSVAVKRLFAEISDRAHRELRVASELTGRSFRHVIPILDSGCDEALGRYFIVMERAERSLANLVNPRVPLSDADAIEIVRDIAKGLVEIDDLVHRDLKPENVLLHEGVWKLADFGIARFVEEATSTNTLLHFLSPQYAAPEQWREERATKKTDMYALGCILYALRTGSPPFSASSRHEFREAHLKKKPPQLPDASRLVPLAGSCLRKLPDSRPSPKEFLERIDSVMESSNPRLSGLAKAATAVAHDAAQRDAEKYALSLATEERKQLAQSGVLELQQLLQRMADEIRTAAPNSEYKPMTRRQFGYEISLGSGRLWCYVAFPCLESGLFQRSGWDVVAGAVMVVHQQSLDYKGRSSNLWFMQRPGEDSYRWREVCYMMTFGPLREEPFGFEVSEKLVDADLAAAPILHLYQLGGPVRGVDAEDFETFLPRWSDFLAEASRNAMRRPQTLPES